VRDRPPSSLTRTDVLAQLPWLETGGQFFPTALGQVFCGLYIEELCLCGRACRTCLATLTRSLLLEGRDGWRQQGRGVPDGRLCVGATGIVLTAQ